MKAFEAKAAKTISLVKTPTPPGRGNFRVKIGAIKKGDTITVAQSGDEYFLWHDAIYTLDKEYIGEKIRDLSNK
ncbi:MAG: hypothetical protein GYA51_05920 [Candidatus Methanofastidiosa archaeon]|nr:hypothetical protein [Candidatus Methanofastidiosa archaeon]